METHQVDDTSGGLLVAGEEETLAGVGGPGNVVESSLGVLLALLVSLEGLDLHGLVTEEEELLAGDQVPGSNPWLAGCIWQMPATYGTKLAALRELDLRAFADISA